MVFRGTVVNGRVEFAEVAELPNGTEVEVRPVGPPKARRKLAGRSTKVSKRPAKRRSPKPKSFLESVAKYVGSLG